MLVTIGSTTYPSKEAARQAIREVLYRYHEGETLNVDDHLFIADVLELHPHKKEKIGCGVASFQVEWNRYTLGFWITRIDGSRTDWSFVACLNPPGPAQKAKNAFREEVAPQTLAFKRKAFASTTEVHCPITGTVLHLDALTHVDHYDPTFEELLQHFLSSLGLSIDQIATAPSVDQQIRPRLADRQLAAAWASFHEEHATLRVVSRHANLSLLRGGRVIV